MRTMTALAPHCTFLPNPSSKGLDLLPCLWISGRPLWMSLFEKGVVLGIFLGSRSRPFLVACDTKYVIGVFVPYVGFFDLYSSTGHASMGEVTASAVELPFNQWYPFRQ